MSRAVCCLAFLTLIGSVPAAAQDEATLSRDNVMQFMSGDRVTAVTTEAEWRQRRNSVVRAMQSIMGPLPDRVDLEPPAMKVLEESDAGSYVRRLIEFASEPESWTPAYLCIPKSVLESGRRAPCVLCLHPTDNIVGHRVVVGLGGKPNRQYAAELAERGFITLAPSYPLLANYQPDLPKLGWASGTLKAVWDNMRALDLLQSLPQAEPDRIAAIGHSLGGHNAVYTAVFDQRIRVIVSSCGLDSYRDYYGGDRGRWTAGRGWTSTRYMPRLADFQDRLDEIPFDFGEMIAALAPRHVLIIAPRQDGNFRADSVDRVASSARPVFALYGDPHRLTVLHPDCAHDFPQDMRERAYQLLDQVLRR